MIKGILFDVGGVLAHDVWESMLLDNQETLISMANVKSVEVATVAMRLWNEFSMRPVTSDADWRKLELEYWSSFIRQLGLNESPQYFINLTDQFIQPVPGMTELLNELCDKGIKTAICSNNTEFWFARQNEKLDLLKFFPAQNITLSSRIGVSKGSPDSRMFQAALESLGLDKRECILVDDREENIIRSVAFGLTSIIFPSHSDRGPQYLRLLFQKLLIL